MRNKVFMMLGFLLIAASVNAFAHSGATGIVKLRMDAMKDTGKQMKIIGEMIKGNTAFEVSTVKGAASTISRHAAEIPTLFPEDSIQSPSEALPVIWSDWNDFVALAALMKSEADQLSKMAQTASNADEIKIQFGRIGKTCSGCHEKYRMKK